MSGFTVSWLALREPHDLRARNAAVLDAVVAALARKQTVDIVDLACGTGSTLRALAPRLKSKQSWLLVDNDEALLDCASRTPIPPNVRLTTRALDLNHELEKPLAGKVDLVTTSALLDLVSEAWLDRLVSDAAARSVPVYAALSYDGRINISPTDLFDAAVIAAVNAHQRRDKGFGPALGPSAVSVAIKRFESLGFSVTHDKADWVIQSKDPEFQAEILRGWASAAKELGGLSSPDIDEWLARRQGEVAVGRSSIRVGHVDFFAEPLIGTR